MTQQQLHLCDFDGTLTVRDSFLHFLLFSVPFARLLTGSIVLAGHFLVLLFTARWSNGAAKAVVMATFFKGKSESELKNIGQEYCQSRLPGLLRPALLQHLRSAVKKGDTVAIVSASMDLWLKPFCTAEGFDCLCTELEYASGQFTGRFSTPNCNKEEKVRRIQSAYNLQEYAPIHAYGNSGGDAAMYELAGKTFKF